MRYFVLFDLEVIFKSGIFISKKFATEHLHEFTR